MIPCGKASGRALRSENIVLAISPRGAKICAIDSPMDCGRGGRPQVMADNRLVEPKNALVKQYRRLFEMEGIDLTFAEEALIGIARKAIEPKTGARGSRSITESILLDTMFQLPSLEGVGKS
jgi:hypothetical protein